MLNDLINKLCPNGVEYKKLSSCTQLVSGKAIPKAMMNDSFPYPVIGGGVRHTGKYNNFNFSKSITISRSGNAGFVNWINENFWAADHCFVSSQKQDGPNIKFVYFYLKSKENELQKHIYRGNIPYLVKNYLSNFPIPIPPLEIQNEIVNILDKFSTLCDDLTSGLPAEIEMREKQYEYYRDQFLTFNEKKV